MKRSGDNGARARLPLLSGGVALLLIALLARLWYLQVLAGERYGELAEGNRSREVRVEAPRGRILDRHGRVLVRNRAAWAVTVKPWELGERKDEVLNRLAKLLGLSRAELDERLNDKDTSTLRGMVVAEDVDRRVLFTLAERAADFPGVSAEVLAFRDYPHGSLAAHLLGYVGEISEAELELERYQGYKAGDMIGKQGVEFTYDRWLRGIDGLRTLEVNALGQAVGTLESREPVPGRDLRLTLDLEVQRATEQALREGMQAARRIVDSQRGHTYPAPAAAAVVLDPRNGELLALASLPAYDPRKFVGGISQRDYQRYANDPAKPLINRTVQSVYPPGSTWKPFVALAALDSGMITPGTTFHCPGSYTMGSYTKRDWTPRGHGSVALTESLRFSCDVYYYNLGARFLAEERAAEDAGKRPPERMQATARAFGFGRKPALDLPFSAAGTVPDREWRKSFWKAQREEYCAGTSRLYQELCREGWRWQGGDNLNIAIGQGDVQVSPLQLALGYAAIANGGTLYQPHLGQAVLDHETGEVVRAFQPKVTGTVPVPVGALRAVSEALATVPAGGTASAAFSGFPLDRIPVAGKTGTADLPPKSPFAWFASYAPAHDPRYVVVVVVEEGGHGGQTAAPIARKIYQHLFNLPVTPVAPGLDLSG